MLERPWSTRLPKDSAGMAGRDAISLPNRAGISRYQCQSLLLTAQQLKEA